MNLRGVGRPKVPQRRWYCPAVHGARRLARWGPVVLAALLLSGGIVATIVIVLVPSVHTTGASANGGTTTAPPTTPPTAPSTTTSTTPPTTTAPLLTAVGTYQVATTSLMLEAPVAVGASSRQMPTTVWYPATSVSGRRGTHGQFPLLVFSQGFNQQVAAYSPLLESWASAGFVVAGPTYPDTDPTVATREDLVNHPADLRSVLTALITASDQPGSALSGLIDANEIGLVGQSDGGNVSLAVADNTCCRYPGIGALAVLSGAEYAGFGGRYFGTTSPPLLVVQGSADTVNPPPCSAQLYDAAPTPKYYLDLIGAGHLPPYETPGGDDVVVAEVTTDFFEAELAGKSAGLVAMTAAGNVAGSATLTEGAAAPPATGICPTAP